MSRTEAFDGRALVDILKHLLRHIPGKLLVGVVVWDRLAHRSHIIKDVLSTGGAQRMQLAQLPSYALDLNPDEGVWNDLNRVELGTVGCHHLTELRDKLRKAMACLRHKVSVIQGFTAKSIQIS